MNVQITMEDASKIVITLLAHSTALVRLDTTLTATYAPVMTSTSVLWVIHALVNASIPLDHSSAGVLVAKHMIRSLTDVLHQTIVLVIRVNIDVLVVATLTTATVCQVTIWHRMVVVVTTLMNANLRMGGAVRCVLISQDHTSVPATQGTHLMGMAVLAVVCSVQIHQP